MQDSILKKESEWANLDPKIFIGTLFVIAKIKEHGKCLLIGEWILWEWIYAINITKGVYKIY